MKKYTLEIYIDEKSGVGVHEKADALNTMDARLILATLEEYKQRFLNYIMITEKQQEVKKEPKKIE